VPHPSAMLKLSISLPIHNCQNASHSEKDDLYSPALAKLAFYVGFQQHIADKSSYKNPVMAWFKNQPLNT